MFNVQPPDYEEKNVKDFQKERNVSRKDGFHGTKTIYLPKERWCEKSDNMTPGQHGTVNELPQANDRQVTGSDVTRRKAGIPSKQAGTPLQPSGSSRVVKLVKRFSKAIYCLLGLGVLSYGVFHFRDSIPFFPKKKKREDPPPVSQQFMDKINEYSTIQKVAGVGALLAAGVAGYKYFSKPGPQDEDESRSATIGDSLCGAGGEMPFWRKHGLKLGLVIIFLAGIVALAFFLPGSGEQNDWDNEEDLEWGP